MFRGVSAFVGCWVAGAPRGPLLTRLVLVVTLGAGCAREVTPRDTVVNAPKYGRGAVPLSRDASFFRRADALDFWALAPHYVGQRDDVSCSLASLTMLVNAARRERTLLAHEPLVVQAALFARVGSSVWEKGLAPDGEGVTLDELGVLATESLSAYGITGSKVEVVHVPHATEGALAEWRELLSSNEANPKDWVIVNFSMAAYLGHGDYGHIAPVGAYDAERRRVLLMDPDREWYEPYWVDDAIALAGMATPDAVTGVPRGYLHVSVCKDDACE